MANEKIRVGIIGANVHGSWGARAHLPALKALPRFEVTAVCTTRQETADETAKQFGIPIALADPQRLVEHPEVDVVAVCVRVPAHDGLVRAALGAGKHVFCEWPLGANTAQAVQMRDLAVRAGVRHMVGLQARGAPVIEYVKDLVAQGYVGQVLSATMIGATPFGGSPIPASRAWFADRSNGANVMTIAGGHSIDALRYCLGDFREVSAVVATRRPRPTIVETGETIEMTAPDQVLVSGTLASGAVASFHISGGTARGTGFHFEIHGTDGDLVIAPADPIPGVGVQYADLILRGGQGSGNTLEDLPIPARYRWVPADVPAGPPYNVAQLFARLAEAIRAGTPADPDFDVAVRNHQLLDAIQTASDTGQRQTP